MNGHVIRCGACSSDAGLCKDGQLLDEVLGQAQDALQELVAKVEAGRPTANMGQLTELAERAYENAVDHGWWEEERETGTLIALMHSELSEALEAERHGNPPSDHIPEFSGLEEEFADVIIRILDLAGRRNLRIEEAVLAKMTFNESRPYKHGGKAF